MIRTKLILTLAFIAIGVFSPGQEALAKEKLSAEVMTSHTKVTAGQEFVLTVRVIDGRGRPVPFIGEVILSTTDSRSTIRGSVVEFRGDEELEVRVRLGTAGNQKIVATAFEEVGGDESIRREIGKDNVTVAVSAGAPFRLSIKTQSVVEAGTGLAVQVTSQDEFGNFSSVDTIAEARIGSTIAVFSIKKGRGTVQLAPTLAGLLQLQVSTSSAPAQFGARLVEVLASEPAEQVILSGDAQVVDRGKTLAPFAVVVTDRFGNPAAGAVVTFKIVSDGVRFGEAAPAGSDENSATSDGEGIAQSKAAKAHSLGGSTVSAFTSGVPSVTFTIEVVQRVERFKFVGLPAVVVAGEPLGLVEVHAVDHLGDLVPTLSGITSVELSGTNAQNGSVLFPSERAITFLGGRGTFTGATFALEGQADCTVKHPTRPEISTTQQITVLASVRVGLEADQPSIFADTGKPVSLSGRVIDVFGNTVPEGGVLVSLALSEIDEVPGRFIAGPLHNTRRLGARVARLGSGETLIAGGEDDLATPILPTIVYHPTTHTFHAGPALLGHRKGHTATALPDGGVLIFGGAEIGAPVAERYDPIAKLFTAVTGPVNRVDHTATSLPDGRVWIVGGLEAGAPTSGTLIFDPSTGLFATGPSLPGPLVKHQALAVADGVIILGGSDGEFTSSSSILHYTAATGELKAAGDLLTARNSFEAVLLDDTTVLVWGGESAFLTPLKDGELIDLLTGTASSVGEISESLTGARLSRLTLGKAILTGGAITTGFPPEKQGRTSSYLFSKSDGLFKSGPSLLQPRFDHMAFPSTPDSGEIVLFCGGPTSSEFYVSTASLKGTFDEDATTKTVETDSDGTFSFSLRVGQGRHEIPATSSGLEGTTFIVEGETVPQELVSLGFLGLPATVEAGESFTGTLVAQDASGALVDYTGLTEVALVGAGPFPTTLLVNLVGGTAPLGEVRLVTRGKLQARLLDNSSVLGVSATIDVLATDAILVRVVSGAGQDVLPGSQLETPVVIEALDRFGNTVPGATVSVSADRGSLGTSTELVTAGAGSASLDSYVAPSAAGAETLRFSLPDVAGSEIQVPLIVTSPVAPDALDAAKSVFSGLVGSSVEVSFKATSAGRPVGGFEVLFRIASGDATLKTTVVLTDAAGIATLSVSSETYGRVEIEAVTGSLTARADVLFAPEGVPVSVSVDLAETIEAGSTFSVIITLITATGEPVTGTHLITVDFSDATSPNGMEFPGSIEVLVDGPTPVDGIVASLTSTISFTYVGEVNGPPTKLPISGTFGQVRPIIVAGQPDTVVVLGDSSREAVPRELLAAPFTVMVVDQLGNGVGNEDVSFQFVDGDSYFELTRVPWATVLSGGAGSAKAPDLRVGQILGTHALWVGAGPGRKNLQLLVKHRVIKITPESEKHKDLQGGEFELVAAMPGEMLSRAAAGRNPHVAVKLELDVAEGAIKEQLAGLTVEYTVVDKKGTASEADGLFHKNATFYRIGVRTPKTGALTEIRLGIRGPDGSTSSPGGGGGGLLDFAVVAAGSEPQLEQFEELGPRAVVESDKDGKAGGNLMLRVPHQLGDTKKAFIRVRVRVLPARGRVEEGPGPDPVYPTIYMRIPIRPPVIKAAMREGAPKIVIAGSPRGIPVDGFAEYELLREVPAAGAAEVRYANQHLFAWVRKKGGKKVAEDHHFFFNWRVITTSAEGQKSKLIVMPKRTAPSGEYEVIVGITPNADPDDNATNPTPPHKFEIKVKRDFPFAPDAKDFVGPTMFTAGAFQRRNIGLEFNGAPGPGLPSEVTLNFRKSKVSVAEKYDVGASIFTNVFADGACVNVPLVPFKEPKLTATGRVCRTGPWVARVAELDDDDAIQRDRIEPVLGLSDFRARLVRKNKEGAFVPIKGPVFAAEVIDHAGRLRKGQEDIDFYVEVVSGDLGTDPFIATQGLPYEEARQSQRVAGGATPLTPSTFYDSVSSFLRRYGVGIPIRNLPQVTKEPRDGEYVYRFGPIRLTHQLLSSVNNREELKKRGVVQFVQVGRGFLYHLKALKTATGSVDFLEKLGEPDPFHTMAHGVRSFRMYGSNGARNIPSRRDFVPQVTVDSPEEIALSSSFELKLRVRDLFADIVYPAGEETPLAGRPRTVHVQYTQEGMLTKGLTFPIAAGKEPAEPGRPHPFLGTAKITIQGADKVPVTRVTVTVANALGTIGQLVFEVRKSDGGMGTIHIVSRCRISHPSIYYAAYEPPGEDELPEGEKVGDKTSKPHAFTAGFDEFKVELTRIGTEREYRSKPFLLIRTPSTEAFSNELRGRADQWHVKWVLPSSKGRVRIKCTQLPLLDENHTLYTHTINARPVPRLRIFNDPTQPGKFVSDDVVRSGDRFEISFNPDYRVDEDTPIEVLVGVRLPDGSINDKKSLTVTLTRQPDGSYRSDDKILVTSQPQIIERGAKVIILPETTAQLKVVLVDRLEKYSLPVVSEIVRDGGDLNPAEALAGNSPEVGVGVYVHNQEQVFRLKLLEVAGRGLNYRLALTHRTRVSTISSVGSSWTHNYDLRLRKVGDEIDFYNGDCRFITFTKKDDKYEPEAGAYLELIKLPPGAKDPFKGIGGYELVSPDKTRIVFGPKEVSGFLLASRIEDPNGNAISFRYGPRGRLAEVQDPFGRSYFYRYDDRGLLREVVDFSGRRFRFLHTEARVTDLSGIVFPKVRSGLDFESGATPLSFVTFVYDGSHRLATYTDRRRKHLFRNKYFADGRLRSQTMADGSGVTLVPGGSKAGGQVGVSNNRGGLTQYTMMGVSKLEAALARTVVVSATSSKLLKTVYTYNAQGEFRTIIAPRKNKVVYEYDDALSPRKRGNLRVITRTAASAMSSPSSLAGYPGFRKIIAAHFLTVKAPELITRIEYHKEFNKPTSIKLPGGGMTSLLYDERGNLKERTHPRVVVTDIGVDGKITAQAKRRSSETWKYNKAGQLVVYRHGSLLRERHYFYYKVRRPGPSGDDLRRVLVGGKPNKPAGASADEVTGGKIGIGKPGGGYLARIEDHGRFSERWFERDERNNTTRLIDERSVVHVFKYNELDILTESRPADKWIGSKDDKSKLTKESFRATRRPVVTSLHDGAGIRTKMTISGITQEFQLDSMGRVETKTVPLAGVVEAVTVYQRDRAGNLRTITDPERDTMTFGYDLANRRISVKSGTDTMVIEYDANGNMISRGFKVGVERRELFFYDGHDRLIAVLNPAGSVTLRTPDKRNRLKRAVVLGLGHKYVRVKAGVTVASNFTIKRFETLSWGERDYNDRGWLTAVRKRVTPQSPNSPKATRLLGYSALGEPVSAIEGLSAGKLTQRSQVTRTYHKGLVDRVFRRGSAQLATAMEVYLFYDPAGNLLTRDERVRESKGLVSYVVEQRFDGLGRTISVSQPGNRLTRFTYDERGNRVGFVGPIDSRTFKFDAANRMTHVFRRGIALKTTSYYRDGMVESQKDARGAKTNYFYRPDKKLRLIKYVDGTSSSVTYTAGGKLGTTTDQNGTILRYEVDDAGQVTRREMKSKTRSDLLAVKSQRFVRDGLGRMIRTHEGGDAGQGKASSEFRAYDGLGRITSQGHSIYTDTASVKKTSRNEDVIASFPKSVHRMIVTSWEDKNNRSKVTYISTGLEVRHKTSRGGLHSTWRAKMKWSRRELSSAIGWMSDGRVKFIHHGVSAGAAVSQTGYTYNVSKQLSGFGSSHGKNFRKATRKYLANGLLDKSSWSDNFAEGSSKFHYLKDGRPLSSKVVEETKRASDFPFRERKTTRSGMTYDKLDTLLTVTGKTITDQRVREKDLFLSGKGLRFGGELSKLVPREVEFGFDRTGSIDSMNRIKTLKISPSGTATHVYDLAGNLTSYSGKGVHRFRSDKLVWDAYGRLRKVVHRSTEESLARLDSREKKGVVRTVVRRLKARTTDSYFWYSASGRRLFKYSDLLVDISVSGKESKGWRNLFERDIVLQNKGEWYTHGRGTVLEESSVVDEVRSRQLKGWARGNTPRRFAIHRQFIGHGKQHDAMIKRDISRGLSGGGVASLLFYPSHNEHYIVRDETGSARFLVRPNGLPEASYGSEITGQALPPLSVGIEPTLWEDANALNYHYSYRGNKADLETDFLLVGGRYYWPELGRFLSVDTMGAWFDQYANGSGYAYAGNNPSRFSDNGNAANVAVGAAIGFLVGGLYGMYNIAYNGGTYEEALTSALIGGVSGAIFGATFGLAVGTLGAGGATLLASTVDGAVSGGLQGYTRGEALRGAAEGAVTGLVLGAVFRRLLGGGGSRCFVAGTLVQTIRGSKPIERIKAGDWVWSRNDETGEQGYKRVKRTFVSHPKELITVVARPLIRDRAKSSLRRSATRSASAGDDDGSGSTEGSEAAAPEPEKARAIELTGTPEHPFWSVTRRCWKTLGDLLIGERLLLSDGREAVVESLHSKNAPAGKHFTTYNFEVEDWHTYFVGSAAAGWVWVHNACLEQEIAALRNMATKNKTTAAQQLHSKITQRGLGNRVVPNQLSSAERKFAEEIVGLKAGTFVGALRKSLPGIDGHLNDVPVSLKETVGGLAAVLSRSSKAESQALKAGISGVELFVRARNVTTERLIDFAQKGPLSTIPFQGTIREITVFTRDGVVRIAPGVVERVR